MAIVGAIWGATGWRDGASMLVSASVFLTLFAALERAAERLDGSAPSPSPAADAARYLRDAAGSTRCSSGEPPRGRP